MPLNLHCICQNSFCHERLRFDIHIFSLLKSGKSRLLSNFVEINNNLCSQDFTLTQSFKISFNSFARSQFLKCLSVRDDNHNDKSLSWLSMQEYFCQKMAFHVNVLNLLSSHILSLLQFENIFLSVDNHDWLSLSRHKSNISCLQPSIRTNRLFSLHLIVIVSEKNARPSCPNLFSWS